jgi:DNA-binding transcriptional ArsR family regulator
MTPFFQSKLNLQEANRMAATFKCLGDPTRLHLLSILLQGEANVSDMAAAIGLSQSAVSHQLRLLRDARFVEARREGQQVFYRINDEHIGDLFERALEHSHHMD